MDRSRLEAFSDGVLAVAITLLALNLTVAGPGHGTLLHQLGDRWPAFLAYLISFVTIGIIWVNHHALVGNIAVVDRRLMFINLILLIFVVLIPFATGTMAQYLTHGGMDSSVAMAIYAAVFEGMSLGFAALILWTLAPGNSIHPVPVVRHRSVALRFTLGVFIYLPAIGLAFISPPAALVVIGLVAVYYIFERTPSPGPASEGLEDR